MQSKNIFVFTVNLTCRYAFVYQHIVIAPDAFTAITRARMARSATGRRSEIVNVECKRGAWVDEIAPDVLAALRAKPPKRGRKGAGGAK